MAAEAALAEQAAKMDREHKVHVVALATELGRLRHEHNKTPWKTAVMATRPLLLPCACAVPCLAYAHVSLCRLSCMLWQIKKWETWLHRTQAERGHTGRTAFKTWVDRQVTYSELTYAVACAL